MYNMDSSGKGKMNGCVDEYTLQQSLLYSFIVYSSTRIAAVYKFVPKTLKG